MSGEMTTFAVTELSRFNDQISSVKQYANVTLADDGIGKVEECHKTVKRLRLDIEAKRKDLKSGALEYGRTVDSIAKQLTAEVEPIEDRLAAERAIHDAEKEREKKEREAAKAAKLQSRIDQLNALGSPIDLAALAVMPDDDWAWFMADEKRKVTERNARIEVERKAAEEFATKQRAERDAEAARMKAELELQAAENKRQAEELAIRKAEIAEQQRIESERMKAERAELEAKQAEIRAKEQAEREAVEAAERKLKEDAAKPDIDHMKMLMCEFKERVADTSAWWTVGLYKYLDNLQEVMVQFIKENGDGEQ